MGLDAFLVMDGLFLIRGLKGAEENRTQPIVVRLTGREGGMDRRIAGVNGACPLVMTDQPVQHDRQATQQ